MSKQLFYRKKKQFWLNQSTDRTVVGRVKRLVPMRTH